MHRLLRLFTLAACLLAAAASHATAYGIDQTDLWGTPGESGWGIQLVQQDDTIFATMFVYGTDNKPAWYIATLLPNGAPFQYAGNVIATTGPYFGAPWNPAQVSGGAVGTMVFTAPQLAQATLNYTVNGVAVAKAITRSTFVHDDLRGTFYGASNLQVVSGTCTAQGFAPGLRSGLAILNDDDDASRNLAFFTEIEACAVSHATRVQTGQFSRLAGEFTCGEGDSGTLTLTEVKVSYASMMARVDYQSYAPGACRAVGYFAGVRY